MLDINLIAASNASLDGARATTTELIEVAVAIDIFIVLPTTLKVLDAVALVQRRSLDVFTIRNSQTPLAGVRARLANMRSKCKILHFIHMDQDFISMSKLSADSRSIIWDVDRSLNQIKVSDSEPNRLEDMIRVVAPSPQVVCLGEVVLLEYSLMKWTAQKRPMRCAIDGSVQACIGSPSMQRRTWYGKEAGRA
ncbi:hypothetical protein ABZP36_005340 [Zizania latifolia]